MGEHDNALREIADARARMSELADELGRRANPEVLKARAKELALEKKDELKHHAKELATHKRDELKQQAKDKALYWKSQAKETAMRKSYEWTDQATHTPRGLGLLGAVLGAGVGSVLMRKAFKSRTEERRYGEYDYRGRDYGRVPVSYARDDRYSPLEGERAYGYGEASPAIPRSEYSAYPTATGSTGVGYGSDYSESESGNLKDRAAGAVDAAKEKVSGAAESVKERVHGATDTVRERMHGATDTVRERASHLRERASHLRERVPSRDELRNRTSDWYGRALNEQPLALALGALALGMLAASLLPVTEKERELIEPAKRKASEGIAQLGDQVSQKLEGSEEQAGSSMQASSSMGSSSGTIPQLPPLDEVTKVH